MQAMIHLLSELHTGVSQEQVVGIDPFLSNPIHAEPQLCSKPYIYTAGSGILSHECQMNGSTTSFVQAKLQ